VLACFSLIHFSTHGLCLQFVFSSSKSYRCPLLRLYFSISCTEFPLCVLFLPSILPCAGSRCSGFDLRDQRLFSPAVVRVGPFSRSRAGLRIWSPVPGPRMRLSQGWAWARCPVLSSVCWPLGFALCLRDT
jgi:hypothetical protein